MPAPIRAKERGKIAALPLFDLRQPALLAQFHHLSFCFFFTDAIIILWLPLSQHSQIGHTAPREYRAFTLTHFRCFYPSTVLYGNQTHDLCAAHATLPVELQEHCTTGIKQVNKPLDTEQKQVRTNMPKHTRKSFSAYLNSKCWMQILTGFTSARVVLTCLCTFKHDVTCTFNMYNM